MVPKTIGLMLLSFSVLVGAHVYAGEEDIRQTFLRLQAAIKARNAEKIWGLMDADSQSDAERAAKAVKAAYGKADDKDKSGFEKRYGLTAKELDAMNGKLFLKSNRFHGKYYEVPGSKLDAIKVKGNTARITYIEDDGDREKLSLVRQEAQWKFILPMPKAVD